MTSPSRTIPVRRESNMELLRIISIVMIIFSHFAVHGNYSFALAELSFLRIWIATLSLLGEIGVNIFVLITGYYLVAAKVDALNLKKIIRFLVQCSFYSIGIFTIFASIACCRGQNFTWKYSVLFPVLSQLWWFASIYFWLFILHPYLNHLLRGLSKGEYQKFLAVLLISFCVIPSIVGHSYHTALLWFIILYVVAGYIRLHNDILLPGRASGSSFCFVAGAVLFCLMVGVRIAGIALESKIPIFAIHTVSLGEMHNVFTFLIALSLFTAFRKITMKYHQWINFLASATFDVYLIHDHPAVRKLLWKNLFVIEENQGYADIILYCVTAVVAVYFSCVVIGVFRDLLFGKCSLEHRFLSKLREKFVLKLRFNSDWHQ